MILRFAIFLSLMSVLVIAGHVYIYRRLVRDTTTDPRLRRIGLVVVAALGVLLIGGRFLQRVTSGLWVDVISGISFVWMGGALFLVLTLLLIGGVRWIASFARRVRASGATQAGNLASTVVGAVTAPMGAASAGSPASSAGDADASDRVGSGESDVDAGRRLFLSRVVAGGAVAATAGIGGYGAWRAYTAPIVTEVPLRIPKLPKELDGFTIAQLTDIHVGNMIERRFMDELVRRTNALQPDLVAITGDLVDGDVPSLGNAVAALGNLKARYGSYFVTGNHEYYSGDEAWTAFLERIGVQVLRNRHVSVGDGAGGKSFDLVGVDDWAGGRSGGQGAYDLDKAIAGRDPDRAAVLLAHQPANFKVAAQKGIDVQLSGHTHGGQLFPFTVFVGLAWEHSAGLYRHGDSHIYVSRGSGFWGPPMRVGSPPEIVKVVLTT